MTTYTVSKLTKILKCGERLIRELAEQHDIGTVDPNNGWGRRLFIETDIDRLKEVIVQYRAQVVVNKRQFAKYLKHVDPTWISTADAAKQFGIKPMTFLRRMREMNIAPAIVLERKDGKAFWTPKSLEMLRQGYDKFIAQARATKTVGVPLLPTVPTKPKLSLQSNQQEDDYVVSAITGKVPRQTKTGELEEVTTTAKYLKLADAPNPFDVTSLWY